jgi:hypothetical protein
MRFDNIALKIFFIVNITKKGLIMLLWLSCHSQVQINRATKDKIVWKLFFFNYSNKKA